MQRKVESITVMEPVTYETSIVTGKVGPTLAECYELNDWPIAKCQPLGLMLEKTLIEPHVFARQEFRRGEKTPTHRFQRYSLKEATEPTWYIGGISHAVKVRYFPLLPRDAKAFAIPEDKIASALQSLWIENVELNLQLKVDLPKQIEDEIERATNSKLFHWTKLTGEYHGPSFLAISYDHEVFQRVKPKPDPIIIGWGYDEKWHVIAAWNIDLDLAAVYEH